MKSNNWKMQKAVVLWSLLVLFSLRLQGEEPELANVRFVPGNRKAYIAHSYFRCRGEIHSGRPLFAAQKIEELKREGFSEKIIDRLEAEYLKEYDPVAWFQKNPEDEAAFYRAFTYSLLEDRDYHTARAVISKMPKSYKEQYPLVTTNVLLRGVDANERIVPGFVVISNSSVKIFRRFPNIINTLANCTTSHYVKWEEYVTATYENKLHLFNMTSRKPLASIDQLFDADVLWSPTGRYLAVRGHRLINDPPSDTVSPAMTENSRHKSYLWVVDTQQPEKLYAIDQFYDFAVSMENKGMKMRYDLRKWIDCDSLKCGVGWNDEGKTIIIRFDAMTGKPTVVPE